jgi:hypothetical protein
LARLTDSCQTAAPVQPPGHPREQSGLLLWLLLIPLSETVGLNWSMNRGMAAASALDGETDEARYSSTTAVWRNGPVRSGRAQGALRSTTINPVFYNLARMSGT